MHRCLIVIAVLLSALPARGDGDADLSKRIGKLVIRWRSGDTAAREGVLAETKALGDRALAALFDRIAGTPRDFPGKDPGVDLAPAPAQRSDEMVMIEVHFAESTQPLIGGARLLDPKARVALAGNVKLISAPRLTVFDGQRANVSVIKQRTYVRSYDEQQQAVQGTVRSGILLDVRPTVAKDKKFVTLELRLLHSELKEPMARLKTAAGVIELPEVLKHEIAITLTLADGGEATLAMPRGDGKPLLVTLHAKLVKKTAASDK